MKVPSDAKVQSHDDETKLIANLIFNKCQKLRKKRKKVTQQARSSISGDIDFGGSGSINTRLAYD